MRKIDEQIANINIPYPQKLFLKVEIEDHLLRSKEDVPEFAPNELKALSDIHNTLAYRQLNSVSEKVRTKIEFTILVTPILGLLYFLTKEDFMINFIYEGGAPMYPILLLGAVLVFRELSLFFKTIIVKDHSPKNLNIDTNSVLIGAFALIALGIGASALGLYFTAMGVASGKPPIEVFFYGLKESLGGIILSSTLAAFILIMHFTTRRLLLNWKAPLSN